MTNTELHWHERPALRAWPAREQHAEDGWLLRFAGGYTKRANSVTLLVAQAMDLPARILRCEQQYAARGLPLIVRL